MKKLTSVSFVLLTLVFCVANAMAQFPDDSRTNQPPFPEKPIAAAATSPKPEPRVVKEGPLAPAPADVANYQYLLDQHNTGLIRLLPRESYDWGVYPVEKKLKIRGGGTFFSFHFRDHSYDSASDLSLDKGFLSVGFAGANYGMLTDIGAESLEQIDLQSPGVAFMLNYKAPTKEPVARIEAQKFYPAFTVEDAAYTRKLHGEVNHTYLLRSINYGYSDVLVAFHIARQDEDGSLIIAWKLLKEFPTPQLDR
ncbi:MAG TPA: hypothetical protein VI306_13280 [Pyrinomonadaceae bacterium]